MSGLPQGMNMDAVVNSIRSGRAVLLTASVSEEAPDLSPLSAEERVRAEAFHHEPSRVLFITGRRILREVLSAFVSDPEVVVGNHGKPHCPHPLAPAFNLSHAGTSLVAVFHDQGPVGVDLEEEHRMPSDPSRLAEKVFSAQERQRMEDGTDSFLDIWTRKEAVLKMTGEGFTAGAGSIDAPTVAANKGWNLSPFSFSGHVGCVCVPREAEVVMGSFLQS